MLLLYLFSFVLHLIFPSVLSQFLQVFHIIDFGIRMFVFVFCICNLYLCVCVCLSLNVFFSHFPFLLINNIFYLLFRTIFVKAIAVLERKNYWENFIYLRFSSIFWKFLSSLPPPPPPPLLFWLICQLICNFLSTFIHFSFLFFSLFFLLFLSKFKHFTKWKWLNFT